MMIMKIDKHIQRQKPEQCFNHNHTNNQPQYAFPSIHSYLD